MIKNIYIKKDEFTCYNKKNEIEAYCSFVYNSNLSKHKLANYSNNHTKKNYSEYDLFDNNFKDKISNFIPFLSEEKKANYIKLKSMKKSLFEEMLKMNKFEEKTKNEKKKFILKNIKKIL